MTVSMLAMESDNGKHTQTPLASIQSGSRYSAGTRQRSWRESDRNIDFFTIPRHWKRLVPTIWKPTIGKHIFIILSPLEDISRSSGSLVKMEQAARGKKTQTMKHSTDTIVASRAVLR